MNIRAELEVATPDPLADAELRPDIFTSQGHIMPCHPVFLMAWPVHFHPHPNTCPLPRALEVQTNHVPGRKHSWQQWLLCWWHERRVREVFNIFRFHIVLQTMQSVLASTSVSPFPTSSLSPSPLGLPPFLGLSSAPAHTFPGTISSPAFFKQSFYPLASRYPTAPLQQGEATLTVHTPSILKR